MFTIYSVILPVFLIFLAGFIGQKIFRLDIRSISTAGLYLMLPALIFRTFYQAKIDSTYLYIMAYGLILSFSIVLIVKVICSIKGYEESVTSGMILSTAFMNNGNLGAPLILFAFGGEAFTYAVTIMVLHTVVMSTAGLYYAARGRASVRTSLLSVIKMPVIHALVAALLWRYFSLPMPDNIFKAVDMVADSSIIVIMLVLGMQMAEIKVQSNEWGKISLASVIRLLVSPLIALAFIKAVPVEPLLGKVMVIEAAMPPAVITTMYALQFDSQPNLVASINFIATLISMVTLSILLILLQ